MKRLVLVMVLVLAVLASWAYAEQKIEVVSGNIPITLTVPADSTGFLYPNPEGSSRALDMDQFWFVYYATDSAGTGRLSGTLNYYLKFFKDGD